MKNLKQAFDTSAVVLADLLSLRLTSWSVARAKATEMHKDYASAAPGKQSFTEHLNKSVSRPEAMTPIRALLDDLMAFLVIGYVLGTIIKFASALGTLVLVLVAGAVAFCVLTWFFNFIAGKPRVRSIDPETVGNNT